MYRVSGFKTEFHEHLNGLWEVREMQNGRRIFELGDCRAFLFSEKGEWRFTNQFGTTNTAFLFAYQREKELPIGVPTEWLGLDADGVPWPVAVTIEPVQGEVASEQK